MASPHDQYRIVVCASGGGGNFQALIDAREAIGFEIARLIADRPCGAIERAKQSGIDSVLLDPSGGKHAMFAEFQQSVPSETNLIVLAGFMPILPPEICERWRGKIINTHPSLLPKYGGKGMYGVKVQEAVMNAKDNKAGCTIHFVNAGIDEGEIILQKEIPVDYRETPWELGGRIFKEENVLLVEAVRILKTREDGQA